MPAMLPLLCAVQSVFDSELIASGTLVTQRPAHAECILNTSMSDSPDVPDAPDESVLGKRVRNEAVQNNSDIQVNSTVEDDSDDNDVGPMPMPAQAPAAKKKRRGMANSAS